MKNVMKKFLFVMLIALFIGLSFGCGDEEEKKKTENIKTTDVSQLKVFSMDLTDIEGYETYKVEKGTWAETYDVMIALSKKEKDAAKRNLIYHKAEDLLMSTGCIVPIYYYTDLYMIKEDVTGFFGLPTGAKYFEYTVKGGKTDGLNVCIASEPDTIDPALNSAVDGATMILHTFAGLVKYDENKKLVADLAKELPTPVVNEDGSVTYVFEIREDAKWSDGTKITAEDFVYSWKRAVDPATKADYGYLYEIISGYGTEEGLKIASLEEGKKFSVTLPVDVPYFFELCAFPTFLPVKKDVVEANPDTWATDPATYITNGAYKMESWSHDSNIVFVKNENYWDADSIKMEKITFYLSADDTSILANYKNGTYDFIDTVPNNEIANLKVSYPKEFKIDGQLGTYYAIFNINTDLVPSYVSKDFTAEEKLAANIEIRQALSLLLDRNYICEAIGQAGQKPASSFVSFGMTEADDVTQFNSVAGGNTYDGYFDTSEEAFSGNCKAAIETLKKYFELGEDNKFTNFTTFEYLYNTGSGHQAIGEYIQSALKAYGIDISLVNQEWNTFLQTRKDGNYTCARNGWSADYNDPINMLDMWTSISGNNDAQFGK